MLKAKKKFFVQRKQAILLINNKVYEREIKPPDQERILDIPDTMLIPYLKKGQPVLLVLPTGGKKRYILQTRILNIYIDRFQLQILDPRASKRFSFSSPAEVKIRPICEATAIRIQTGEVKVVRSVDAVLLDSATGDMPEAQPCRGRSFSVKDMLLRNEGDDQDEDFHKLEGQTPTNGAIIDISLGGMCLSCRQLTGESFFADQLVAVECAFAKEADANPNDKPISLFVLAVVRSTKKSPDDGKLNLQFLAGLPKAIDRYWSAKNQD